MFRKLVLICTVIVPFLGCNQKTEPSSSDIDAAHTFIKFIQDNNFDEAEKMMLMDEENTASLNKLKKAAESKSSTELEQYKNADIIIDELAPLNDTISIVHYSISSNMNQKNKLKMVKRNGKWLVDLKYTFSGNL